MQKWKLREQDMEMEIWERSPYILEISVQSQDASMHVNVEQSATKNCMEEWFYLILVVALSSLINDTMPVAFVG